MNPPTLQRRTRHRNPHDGTTTAEVRGLFTIILLAISVIHFRFDQMTTPHSLTIEQLLTPLSAAREPNRCALRTASKLAVRRRRVPLAGAAASPGGLIGSSRHLGRSLMVLACTHGFVST